MTNLCDVMPHDTAVGYQRFGKTFCLHLRGKALLLPDRCRYYFLRYVCNHAVAHRENVPSNLRHKFTLHIPIFYSFNVHFIIIIIIIISQYFSIKNLFAEVNVRQVFTVHVINVYSGSWGTAPLILNHSQPLQYVVIGQLHTTVALRPGKVTLVSGEQ